MNQPGFLVRVALGVGLARRTAPAVRMQTVNEAPPPDLAAQPRRTQPAQPLQNPQPHAQPNPQPSQRQSPARTPPAAAQPRAPEQTAFARPNGSAPKAVALPGADGLPERAGESDISTVIPAAAQLNGDLEIAESIVLQCVVRGNVTQLGEHQVVLTATSGIHGTLRAHTAVIGGTVEGDVFAERVVVLETGQINGNVEYTTLAMKEGACINGALMRIVPNVIGVSDGGAALPGRGEQPGLRAVSMADQERVA